MNDKPTPPKIAIYREGTVPGEKSLFSRLLSWLLGCWHDWETVRIQSRSAIRGHNHYNERYEYVRDRVCLKCGLRDNRIDRFVEQVASEEEEKRRRKELAKKLTGESK